jgi:hypothetical protein
MSTIRAVLLDADGVVQLPGSAWSAALGLLCGDPSRADEFRTDVFAAERSQLPPLAKVGLGQSGLICCSTHPHQILLNLRYFFAIQQRQQITEPRIADQKLKTCPAAAD